ncbi:MAG: NAD(P)/FAD-dependent oxidoreductase [Bacillota bacterium]
MRHVIIGNSAAGVSAAETIRRLDPDCSITVISDEIFPAYSRCLLPDYLAGDIEEKRLSIRGKNFYVDNRIETRLGKRVVSIDSKLKRVVLQDRETVPYDRLLIATGSVTTFPPLEGMELPGVFGLRTLGDAQRILEEAGPARRAVVIGAGLVGLEAAYALYRRGLEVTVVEKAAQIIPLHFDETASEVLKKDMEAEGIRLILGTGIQKILGPSLWEKIFRRKGKGVVLEDGRRIKCELVVVATGARPNTDIVRDTGIRVNRGIVVDHFMQTSVPGIYAAGDVAETVDVVTGEQAITPIWPNAVVQGRYAGYNMAGRERRYGGMIGMQNTVEFREVPAIAVGDTRGRQEGCEVMMVYHPEENIYWKLIIKDNVIKGMILVGDISRAGIYSALIRANTDISGIKERLLRDDFDYGHFLKKAVSGFRAS